MAAVKGLRFETYNAEDAKVVININDDRSTVALQRGRSVFALRRILQARDRHKIKTVVARREQRGENRRKFRRNIFHREKNLYLPLNTVAPTVTRDDNAINSSRWRSIRASTGIVGNLRATDFG